MYHVPTWILQKSHARGGLEHRVPLNTLGVETFLFGGGSHFLRQVDVTMELRDTVQQLFDMTTKKDERLHD